MRRWIASGTPGAGKTSIVEGLAARGHQVVREAATDVVAAHGPGDEHWERAGFLDDIVMLQRARELAPVPPGTAHQVFDRSPLCTLALARHLGRPATPALQAEVDRVLRDRIVEPDVLFVEWLGFLTPTQVRRIDVPQTLSFDRTHREVYAEHGFRPVEIPVAPLPERIEAVEALISAAAPELPGQEASSSSSAARTAPGDSCQMK